MEMLKHITLAGVCSFLIGVLASPIPSQAQWTGDRMNLIELSVGGEAALPGGAVLLFREAGQTIELYHREGDKLASKVSRPSNGRFTTGAWWPAKGLIIAGYEVLKPHEPTGSSIRVVTLDPTSLEETSLLFEAPSTRPHVLKIQPLEDRIFLNFFESKFISRAGYLLQGEEGGWEFEELFRTRLGMYVEHLDDGGVVVGRPYPDPKDQSVELRLWQEGGWIDLPSLRGISSVAALKMPEEGEIEQILFADGWHQNYGEFAEPRLSRIAFGARKRVTLTQLDTLLPQQRVEKISVLKSDGRVVVVIHGGQFIDILYPEEDWRRQRVYSRQNKNALPLFDFAVLELQGDKLAIAALEGDGPELFEMEI